MIGVSPPHFVLPSMGIHLLSSAVSARLTAASEISTPVDIVAGLVENGMLRKIQFIILSFLSFPSLL